MNLVTLNIHRGSSEDICIIICLHTVYSDIHLVLNILAYFELFVMNKIQLLCQKLYLLRRPNKLIKLICD